MSTLSSVNVTDVNLVLKERTHMCLCLNMLIFTHNLGNWLINTTEDDLFCAVEADTQRTSAGFASVSFLSFDTQTLISQTAKKCLVKSVPEV